MFDARSILDILLGGGAGQPGQRRPGAPPESGTFRDLLGQLGQQGTQPSAQPQPMPQPQAAPEGRWTEPARQAGPQPTGGSIEDLLRQILGGGQAGPAGGQQTVPGGRMGPSGGDLQEILRELLGGGGGGRPRPEVSRMVGEGAPPQGGDVSLLEALKQVLGQATEGMREGAGRIDQATGASDRARAAITEATGQTPEELIARLRDLATSNQLATGAALGGLGALVLGTRAGRSLATSAVKLGGLAVIGGLAYKAYQNYQQGKPIIAGRAEAPQALAAAPDGSGFEPGAVSHAAAQRCIRAMIAAAAADGRIDTDEQQKILGSLQQAGIAAGTQQFLAAEIANPATPAELAAGVASPEEAVQVYTAARVAIDLNSNEEHAFLASLAAELGVDDALAAQIDAAARGVAA
jgi:uncharacterized membrane protein YebE (DUF533 family)